MFYIGIDSGTQSTKSVVLDFETGEIVAQESQPYDLISDLPAGHLEQHPSDWIDTVKNTVASCLHQLGDRRAEVRLVRLDGHAHHKQQVCRRGGGGHQGGLRAVQRRRGWRI